MEELTIKRIWMGSSENEEISIDKNKLIDEFKHNMENRERIVRRRDLREILAALIGLIGFGFSFYSYPYSITKVGSIIGFGTLLYTIFKLRNNRKSKFLGNAPLSIQQELDYQKMFMVRQANLLSTVLYWVSIPLFVANTLIIWGISKSEDELNILEQLATKWEIKLLMTLLIALFFGYIAWMNKKAAKVNWEPLIQQITLITDSLKKEKN